MRPLQRYYAGGGARLERGWEVISDIEYAARVHRALGHANPVVAVTGANGKTTTTSMIDHMLRHEGLDVDCVGNIGTSWSRRLAERVSRDEGEAPPPSVAASVILFSPPPPLVPLT